MNYSTTGFQLVLTRKMSFYVVTYYLPSGLFVVVSWIRSASAECRLELQMIHRFSQSRRRPLLGIVCSSNVDGPE